MKDGSYEFVELDKKNIYQEKVNNYFDAVKFAIPNVKAGSVIEYTYKIASPFIFNFRKWEFQSAIPKQKSEYFAKIPANYNYNISLAGFYKLSNNKAELIKDCFRIGGGVADCSMLSFEMKDIPAFIEEEHMTSARNFKSAINFELEEIRYFNGSTRKFTKTWQDVYQQLKSSEDFGLQIKRNSDLFKEQLKPLLTGGMDKEAVARKVYSSVKDWYTWNKYYGKYSDLGLKKAYESRSGNIADINLALIGALQYANIDTEPVLISTRENGSPTKLFPVLSEFNYVIAKINIDGKSYLLDASDKEVEFGTLPFRCLNAEGRAIGKDSSYWVNLVPSQKFRRVDYMNLKLEDSGILKGTILKRYYGYDAISHRKRIKSFSSPEKYVEDLEVRYPRIKFLNPKISNADSLHLPLTEEYEVEIEAFDSLLGDKFSLNPFIAGYITENPFKLNERVYPVDFGASTDHTTTVTIQIPEGFQLDYVPDPVAIQLPGNTGRYYYKTSLLNNNTVSLTEKLTLDRTVYDSNAYPFLKELYNRVVQTNKLEWVISKSKQQ
ncbi:DUF3857 domain-containing protein [Pseudoxanthomonas sp. SGD-10]|nr:DUF3857 domain-containing protein [Pseudoxanthomonas sp. SGD-10]